MTYEQAYLWPLYAYGAMVACLLFAAVVVPETAALVRRRRWLRGPRLWWLRRKARGLYLAYDAAISHIDCGHAMGAQISPRITGLALRFEETMDAIRELDPSAPLHTRLGVGL